MKRTIYYFAIFFTCFSYAQNTKTENILTLFDSNKDGVLNPYEALDVLLTLEKEKGKKLSIEALKKDLLTAKSEQQKEFKEEFQTMDTNKDGIVQFSEADEETLNFLALMDTNKDDAVTEEEMFNFDPEKAFLLDEKGIQAEVNAIFKDLGTDDSITLNDVPKEVQEQFVSMDQNKDGKLTKKELLVFMRANNTSAYFKVKGNVAYMNGVISSSTPARVLELLNKHPEVTTIEMGIVPGSIDDVSNLRASLYVHKAGLNTRLTPTSMIASGGTDFFLAGKKRTAPKGASIGVHSWGGTVDATKLSKDDEAHEKYLHYYRTINIPEDFYWYTLKAAPANGMHTMTNKEISKYNVQN
ncbi:hypothetical protein [Tenacibaculum amylolyticum]|uniref:hypothetical protein n=1 Tax=Tenacibaculum amylolyticum TaxID=104269 RepID=UPI003893C483